MDSAAMRVELRLPANACHELREGAIHKRKIQSYIFPISKGNLAVIHAVITSDLHANTLPYGPLRRAPYGSKTLGKPPSYTCPLENALADTVVLV